MKHFLLVLPIFFLSGCLTSETQLRLDTARRNVAMAKADLESAMASGATQETIATLQAKYDKAEQDLAKAETRAGKERSSSFNAIVKAIASQDWYTVATTVGSGILVGLGAIKGRKALSDRKAKKKATPKPTP